jgi:translation initiation factor 2 subunit 1
MEIIKTKNNLTDAQMKELEEKILQKYDYVYDLFEATARKGIEPVQNLELSAEIAKAIEEESKKIQIPHVEIRGILEISIKKPDGIDVIKSVLSSMESSKNNSHVAISYIAAPRYRIVITTENFKSAEKLMNNTVEKVRSSIVKHHGAFNFIRLESKKTHSSG